MTSVIKMDSPICLIENKVTEGKTYLAVNPAAIEILSTIHQSAVVVAIVGMYWTGKSYLMNRLAGTQQGFSLASTAQSETKGIWMWCVPHPINKDRTLVLLDTEGLGDVQKGDSKNDSKIFTLAILLSSALVYNSMGTINLDALDKLKSVAEITELIKVKTGDAQDNEANYSTHFPIFIWSVRDFSLELKMDGKEVTADCYLEKALTLKKPESSSEDKEYNDLRNRLRMYFGTRKCFVFDAPTDSKKQLTKLEQLCDDKLDAGFVAQSTLFCDYIFKNAKVKSVNIIENINGPRLAELAKIYTEAINSSNVACLEDAAISLAEKENKAAIKEAVQDYEDKMKTVELPTETFTQFLEVSSQYEDEARQIFLKRSFKDKEHTFLKEFIENINEKRSMFSTMNDVKSQKKCEDLIKKYSGDFEKALSQREYHKSGGHRKFKKDFGDIEENYNMQKGKGVTAEEVLTFYIQSKQGAAISIIHNDGTLNQRQKEQEAQNTEKQIEERKQKVEQQKEDQEKQRTNQEIAGIKLTVEQLKAKMEKDKRKMSEKLQQVIVEKERERDLYQKQGEKKHAIVLEKHIQVIKEEKKGPFSRIGGVIDYGIQKIPPWLVIGGGLSLLL